MKGKAAITVMLVLIAGVSTLLLGMLYSYTAPIVEMKKEIELEMNILDAFGIEYTAENISDIFRREITIEKNGEMLLYKYYKEGSTEPEGIACVIGGSGFWAPITALMLLTPDLKQIKELKILENQETPGLGGRITEAQFLEQFKDLMVSQGVETALNRPADKDNEFECITGATQTSEALKKIINNNYNKLIESMK